LWWCDGHPVLHLLVVIVDVIMIMVKEMVMKVIVVVVVVIDFTLAPSDIRHRIRSSSAEQK